MDNDHTMSATPHKANPELWAAAERWSRNTMDMANCLLELRARVEALEANSQSTPNVGQIRSSAQHELADAAAFGLAPADHFPDPTKMVCTDSLVERVAGAIADSDSPRDLWADDARAAIRVQAAWLRDRGFTWVAQTLEQEVKR